MLQITGLILAIATLIVLVYHRVNSVVCVIIASLIAGISNSLGVWEITEIFASGMLDFMKPILFVFIISAIYGKMMDKTGNAFVIARVITKALGERNSILALILATALLVYGGISVFTVIFCIYPIALAVFKRADIPEVLIPAVFTIGQSTFAMTALPGSPQMNNIIPGQYFGTTLTAAPVLGLICATLMLVLSYRYILACIRKMKAKGIGFYHLRKGETQEEHEQDDAIGSSWKAFTPIAVLFVMYFLLSRQIIPNSMDIYQAVVTSMMGAILVIPILNPEKWKQILSAVQEGSTDWIKPLINLSIIIGFGSVVRSTAGFRNFVELILGLEMNPYCSVAFGTALVACITGSASGGIAIACETFASTWLLNANPQILHRICSIASCSLDSLPHCGGLYSTFDVCHLEMKDAYRYVFVVTVLIPAVATIAAIILGNMGVC